MPRTMIQTNQANQPASQKVKPKIDTVRLEQLVTQCLIKNVPISIITDSYDISYRQIGLILNLTHGFEHQTTKMDHTFDSFSYEQIPEDYFAIPHVLPEEKHYDYEKVIQLFEELEELKTKLKLITFDPEFLAEQIRKQKEKIASYDQEKIANIQGFINEFDAISLHIQPTPEIFLHLLSKYHLSIQEKDSLNKLYDEYLEDQNKLLILEQEQIRQQKEEREYKKLERRYNQIRDDLVIHNIKLVNWCIRKFFNGIPLPKEDAQAYGLEGLTSAINQFNYKKGFHFSSYAVPAIIHHIQRNFKDLTGYSWRDYVKINSINYYRELMKAQSGSDHRPTPEELANMGLIDLSATEIQKYDEIERYGRIVPLSSVQREIEPDYPTTRKFEMPTTQEDYDAIDDYEDQLAQAEDIIGTITDSRVTDYAYSVMVREALLSAIETLIPRERKVIEHSYGLVDGKPKTTKEIAPLLNVGRQRISQIEKDALRNLRHPMRAKLFKDFSDINFHILDQLQLRPKTHIAIENIYTEYYSLLELNLDEQDILMRLEKEYKKSTPYRVEYILENLTTIEEAIIKYAIQGTPLDVIRFTVYDHQDVLFSDEFIINVLTRYKNKLPEQVIEKLEEKATKKM